MVHDDRIFSFPDSTTDYESSYSEVNKFVGFNSGERDTFRTVVSQVMGFTNLTLTEATVDSTASIPIAKTVTPAADAWAYYPGTGKGGDAWFDTNPSQVAYGGKGGMNYSAIQPGDYTYTVFMHEFGHSLGLKHSFEKGGVAGAVPKQYDSLEYTVMSYDAYQTIPYNKSVDGRDWWADDGNNPQTFMMLDIAALQSMYGADYTFNNSATVYKWNASGGYSINNGDYTDLNSNTDIIFMTVWDGGGVDTYDFSNYSLGVRIDLNAGGWVLIDYLNTSSPTQRADLLAGDGTYWATGNIANALMYNNNTASLIENAIGGDGNDFIIGNQIANTLNGGLGNDLLDGGLGLDILIGGAGGDIFIFDTVLSSGNIDTIQGFVAGSDEIWLENTGIFATLAAGDLVAGAFVTGTKALDFTDRIIYNPNNGGLYYDADGTGTKAAVQFATITSLSGTLTAGDFPSFSVPFVHRRIHAIVVTPRARWLLA